MPPEERREAFRQYRGHLAQELGRHTQHPCIALFVREWKFEDENNAGEHLHFPIWVPDEKTMEIIRGVHPEYTLLEWNDGRHGALSRLLYVQKQRAPQFEGFLKKNRDERPRYPWEKPMPIVGRRWSPSNALKQLILNETPDFAIPKNRPAKAARVRVKTPVAPVLKVVVNNALAPGELQLSLLSEKPVTRLRDFGHGVMPRAVAHEVEERRRWQGLTQAQLAAAVGVSRPTLVNILQGTFGASEWVAGRLRDYLLHGREIAA